jgi:hypothetical protein
MNNKDTFKKLGYVVVKSAIQENLRDFVTQYALFDEMQKFTNDDAQVPAAHSKYADPAMETILLHLHPIIEENTGLKLFPTYSYHRVYRNGDKLDVHRDRPSCEISATLCFNYDYNDLNNKWPIWMQGKEVFLEPGDMVIYKGCELDHWRDELKVNNNAWHVQGFFHYVDSFGPYADFKFDKRESLGLKKDRTYNQTQISHSVKKPYIIYTN